MPRAGSGCRASAATGSRSWSSRGRRSPTGRRWSSPAAWPPVVGPVAQRPQPDPPPPLTVYGAAFDHVASPSRPIVGVVRDRDTGAPLAGVRVVSRRMPGKAISRTTAMPGAITDATGGYVLHGHPKAGSYAVAAVPGPGQPYLVGHARVADTPGTRTAPRRHRAGPRHPIPGPARRCGHRPAGRRGGQLLSAPPEPGTSSGSSGFGAAGDGPLSRARANPDGVLFRRRLAGPGGHLHREPSGDISPGDDQPEGVLQARPAATRPRRSHLRR